MGTAKPTTNTQGQPSWDVHVPIPRTFLGLHSLAGSKPLCPHDWIITVAMGVITDDPAGGNVTPRVCGRRETQWRRCDDGSNHQGQVWGDLQVLQSSRQGPWLKESGKPGETRKQILSWSLPKQHRTANAPILGSVSSRMTRWNVCLLLLKHQMSGDLLQEH